MEFEALVEVFVNTLNLDAADITMEAVLAEDLHMDSLDAMELNMAIEDACGKCIPDAELSEVKTVGDIFNKIHA